jgi:hypothetical protein
MSTFSLPSGVWSGTLSYDPSQVKEVANAFYDLQTGALLDDPHLDVPYQEMVIPGFGYATVDLTPFTDKVNFTGCHPSAFNQLYSLGPYSSEASKKTLVELSNKDLSPEFMMSYTMRSVTNHKFGEFHVLTDLQSQPG